MPVSRLDALAATPEIIRLLMEGLAPEDAAWKPAPDRWSIAEVLEHLSHIEGHCFRARLERMLSEDDPELPVYDQEAFNAAAQYSGRDPEESFAHFEEQRADNVAVVRGLEARHLKRAGRHAAAGRITIANLLAQWVFHDLGHIRQIAELVRARRDYPELGPFAAFYSVQP
jgi:hypothetical protein